MRQLTGLVGREALVEQIAREARKGRHLLLTGPPGIGKSAVLEAVIDRLLPRQQRIVIQVGEHQAKGQFLEIARGLLESGLLKPSALELGASLDALDPARLEWAKLRRLVENAFLALKQWRGIATRYAKNSASFPFSPQSTSDVSFSGSRSRDYSV